LGLWIARRKKRGEKKKKDGKELSVRDWVKVTERGERGGRKAEKILDRYAAAQEREEGRGESPGKVGRKILFTRLGGLRHRNRKRRKEGAKETNSAGGTFWQRKKKRSAAFFLCGSSANEGERAGRKKEGMLNNLCCVILSKRGKEGRGEYYSQRLSTVGKRGGGEDRPATVEAGSREKGKGASLAFYPKTI